jgi:hypothetical protein
MIYLTRFSTAIRLHNRYRLDSLPLPHQLRRRSCDALGRLVERLPFFLRLLNPETFDLDYTGTFLFCIYSGGPPQTGGLHCHGDFVYCMALEEFCWSFLEYWMKGMGKKTGELLFPGELYLWIRLDLIPYGLLG